MSNDSGQRVPRRSGDPRTWWVVVTVVVVAVVAMAVGGVVLLRGGGAPRTGGGTTPTSAPPSAAKTSGMPSSSGSTPTHTRSERPAAFPFQPLWPFANAAEAREWQHESGHDGHQPWHLDAAATALAFARGYLGYGNIDLVVSTDIAATRAWVGVGFALPADGRTATAAVIHLARFSTGAGAPWEVVGTRDSTLTADQPTYGSTITSPMRVGGRITGVDENVRVRVHRLHHGLVGETAGLPAGGLRTPWHDTVSFHAPPGSVLTVAVSTGGHVEAVERFAITGVRVG